MNLKTGQPKNNQSEEQREKRLVRERGSGVGGPKDMWGSKSNIHIIGAPKERRANEAKKNI